VARKYDVFVPVRVTRRQHEELLQRVTKGGFRSIAEYIRYRAAGERRMVA
jgi:Arc/MetJ-type ribon-helix-helix transcriptional regulator